MDRTEELKKLKKEIFNLNLQMAMKSNTKEDLLVLAEKVQELQRKINILSSEIANSNGQVGFAFTDLVEISKLEVKKGR